MSLIDCGATVVRMSCFVLGGVLGYCNFVDYEHVHTSTGVNINSTREHVGGWRDKAFWLDFWTN